LLIPRYGFRIREGDVLTLKVSGWILEYKINGSTVYRTRIPVRYWTLGTVFGTGTSYISGVTVNGEPAEFSYTSSDVSAEQAKKRSYVRTVMVGNECDATLPNGVAQARSVEPTSMTTSIDNAESDGSSAFMVRTDGDGSHTLTAELTLGDERAATLLVYDTAGHLVSELPFNGGASRSLSFSVHSSGIYVVKAITDGEEFTRKVIVK